MSSMRQVTLWELVMIAGARPTISCAICSVVIAHEVLVHRGP